MTSINIKPKHKQVTIVIDRTNTHNQLVQATLACMLWEDQFYVSGKSHAETIKELVFRSDPKFVQALALKARTEFKLRHVPLLLLRELARNSKLEAQALTDVIQRADEMSEFLALYWKDGKTPISNQVKKGLANAFVKFNEYQLAKWDKNSAAVSLRDVMFLSHAKPANVEQEVLFKKVANQQLSTPDTWETQLSGGADKRETFTRLMQENKLGALAFLRNLRNMVESGVPNKNIIQYSKTVDTSNVLPFRYIAAKNVVPHVAIMLEGMMLKSLTSMRKLPGKTVLLVDVSGSMFGCPISAKSDLDRFNAAAALAILCNAVCENVEIYTFSSTCVQLKAPSKGFALVDQLSNSQSHSSTYLGKAMSSVNANTSYDRVIVFTDEQSHDIVPNPRGKGYIVNVAANTKGVDYGNWIKVNGFSEAVIKYIQEYENSVAG